MHSICSNIDFDYCSHCLLDLWSRANITPYTSVTSDSVPCFWKLSFNLNSMLISIKATLYLGITSEVPYSLSEYSDSSIGWCSTRAEADIRTLQTFPHFWLSSAVHSLITQVDHQAEDEDNCDQVMFLAEWFLQCQNIASLYS